jgi:hypothetical protein
MIMELLRKKLRVIQNMGWLDRVLRVLVGMVMLGYPIFLLVTTETIPQWPFYSMILSIYPWLTGIIGVDPIYRMFDTRTCDIAGRNACGTFPFEVDAALGNNPIPKNDGDHSLADSRH